MSADDTKGLVTVSTAVVATISAMQYLNDGSLAGK